ncbi:MAG: acyltransferase [Bacteriovorax sp.]|nr:acyltransferase [Bacteriovorax sp.]
MRNLGRPLRLWNWIFPEGSSRIHPLDVLRAIAIIAVIFYHFPKSNTQVIWRAFTHFGSLGVDLFFVLSGYLIGGQVFNNIKSSKIFSIKTFYLKRFLRTLPSYYFILILNIFIIGSNFFDWRYFVFVQNFGGLYQFTPSWSLCIEEHFYLFFPLVISFFYQRNKLQYFPFFVLGLIVMGFIWRYSYWKLTRPDLAYIKNVTQGYEYYFKYIFYPTIGRLDGIALGTLIAFTKIFNESLWDKLLSKSNYLLISGMVLLGILAPLIYLRVGWFNVFFGFPLISVAFSLILISATSSKSILTKIKIPGITTISLLSYSLYLTHVWAIDVVQRFCKIQLMSITSPLAYILMLILALFFALTLYLTVERPFLQLRHKLLIKKTN